MRPSGFTFVVYDGPLGELAPGRDALLRRLRSLGMTDVRAISHNRSGSVMFGKFYPHEYMTAVRDVVQQYKFTRLYDVLNARAIPLTGDCWVDENRVDVRQPSSDPELFRIFLDGYIRYMAQPGLDYRLVWGNEPDADPPPGDAMFNPYRHDEHAFRARFRIVAEVVQALRADPTFKGTIKLGAGGWVADYQRAADFVAWAVEEGLPLDFADVHCYIDPDRVRQAAQAIRAVSSLPIVISESGAAWDHRIKPPTAAAQRNWYRATATACDDEGIERLLLMHGAAGSNCQALSIMGPRGGLTPIGQLVAA